MTSSCDNGFENPTLCRKNLSTRTVSLSDNIAVGRGGGTDTTKGPVARGRGGGSPTESSLPHYFTVASVIPTWNPPTTQNFDKQIPNNAQNSKKIMQVRNEITYIFGESVTVSVIHQHHSYQISNYYIRTPKPTIQTLWTQYQTVSHIFRRG